MQGRSYFCLAKAHWVNRLPARKTRGEGAIGRSRSADNATGHKFFLDRESPIEERSDVSNVSDFKADRALSLWRCLTVEIIERQGTINRLKEEFFWGKARADPGQMQEVIRVESNHVFASKTESIRFHNKIKTQKALVRLRAS